MPRQGRSVVAETKRSGIALRFVIVGIVVAALAVWIAVAQSSRAERDAVERERIRQETRERVDDAQRRADGE